jgi:hypothetical protein
VQGADHANWKFVQTIMQMLGIEPHNPPMNLGISVIMLPGPPILACQVVNDNGFGA